MGAAVGSPAEVSVSICTCVCQVMWTPFIGVMPISMAAGSKRNASSDEGGIWLAHLVPGGVDDEVANATYGTAAVTQSEKKKRTSRSQGGGCVGMGYPEFVETELKMLPYKAEPAWLKKCWSVQRAGSGEMARGAWGREYQLSDGPTRD